MKVLEKLKKRQEKGPKLLLVGRSIPYVNKPITEENADRIGMNTYVDYLESAIENGADMISVVSRFGTGKSSLIALLKSKYRGWSKVNEKEYERVYCEINLWSQLEWAKEIKDEEGKIVETTRVDALELHRAFLYQLVSSIYPNKSSFISRRTSRNFGMFKISTESGMWSAIVSVLAIAFTVLMFLQGFSDQIVSLGVFEKNQLDGIVLFGYILGAIVLLLTLLKTEVLFSSKNSEGNREIEENEIIDLYHKHILVKNTFWNKCKTVFQSRKHLVVIIEDLDRTENGDSVYHFLKELRKYYLPNDQQENTFVNRITFIVNIMPEDKLHEICADSSKENYVYDKLFDYSLNLNRINIDNFDAILEALIQEKKAELQCAGIEVYESDNVHLIPGMQWIVRGKELSLRQLKERLNDSIVLYESLIDKFDKSFVEFQKCAVVAYLRSAFSKWFYDLDDKELEKMVTWYAKNVGSETEFVNEFENGDRSKHDFLRELYKMIVARLIDGNYRTYFFNYPKNSIMYNVQQTKVRNLIVYDDKLSNELNEDITVVAKDNPGIIIDALQNVIELISRLPDVVLFSPELWKISQVSFSQKLDELIDYHFSIIDELGAEEKNLIDNMIDKPDGAHRLAISTQKSKLEVEVSVRQYVVERHPEYISDFTILYKEELAPLTEDELNHMDHISLLDVLKMVNGTVHSLEAGAIGKIHNRVIDENDEVILGEALNFYEELVSKLGIVAVAEEVVQYIIAKKMIIPQFARAIYDAIIDEELDKSHYFRIIYNVPPETVEEEQMMHLAYFDEPGNVSESLCKRMKELGFLKEYILHMLMVNPSRIDLSWHEVQEVIGLHGQDIWENHPKLFQEMRQWACKKYKDDMINQEAFFKEPYPMLTNEEAMCFVVPDTIFKIYDIVRAGEDTDDVLVNYCNRQFRNGKIAFRIFSFIADMPQNAISKIFYKLNMKKVRFSLVKGQNRSKVVEMLRVPLKLNTAKEILRFMNFTECLMPELESEIRSDLKEDKSGALCMEYIEVVNKYGKFTVETLKTILAMKNAYAYGPLINAELYKRKQYTRYVCSKTRETGEFLVEYDKLDVLWDVYMKMFKDWDTYSYTCPKMSQNKDFLMLIQNKKEYTELPEKGWLAMASIPQDEETLIEVLHHKDELVVEYFSKIVGFSSKVAAERFVKIMKQNQKYAQKSSIYINVHPKLGNGSLKGQYTKLYKEANR